MKIATYKQGSAQWWADKKGRIGGTRFGQLISGRKNALQYELADEQLTDIDSFILDMESQYITEDMQAGTDNEPIARQLYIEQSGIDFQEVGFIYSDFSDIHGASPDGWNAEHGIVLELKYTRHGAKQIQRFVEGPETDKMPQIYNYFAASDDVKQVRWVSYCPDRHERQLVEWIYTPETVVDVKKNKTISDMVREGRALLPQMEAEVKGIIEKFKF